MSHDRSETTTPPPVHAPPRQRTPVELDGGRLRIGPHARHIDDPRQPDQVYSAYVSLLYALRGGRPGQRLPLRKADLDALLAIVGDDPATMEQRLIELMGCTEQEASALRVVLMRHSRMVAAMGVAATLTVAGAVTVGGTGTSAGAPLASTTDDGRSADDRAAPSAPQASAQAGPADLPSAAAATAASLRTAASAVVITAAPASGPSAFDDDVATGDSPQERTPSGGNSSEASPGERVGAAPVAHPADGDGTPADVAPPADDAQPPLEPAVLIPPLVLTQPVDEDRPPVVEAPVPGEPAVLIPPLVLVKPVVPPAVVVPPVVTPPSDKTGTPPVVTPPADEVDDAPPAAPHDNRDKLKNGNNGNQGEGQQDNRDGAKNDDNGHGND